MRALLLCCRSADGAAGHRAMHACSSWCSEQLAAYELELAELRQQIRTLREDSTVGIEARVRSDPAARGALSGDSATGGSAPENHAGLPLLPRQPAARATTARLPERAWSQAPTDLRTDPKGKRGKMRHALLPLRASSPTVDGGACSKSEVEGIIAAGDEMAALAAVFGKLATANPLCAACISVCANEPGFDRVPCAYACRHEKENSCGNKTGWDREETRSLLRQVDLQSRDSIIRLMAEVLSPNAILLSRRIERCSSDVADLDFALSSCNFGIQ